MSIDNQHRILIKNLVIIVILLSFYNKSNSQGIRLSHHDFRGAYWSGNEYCLPCHTPNLAVMEAQTTPLWNDQITEASFEMYTDQTLEDTKGLPAGETKLCLSCHDGTIAINYHGGSTNKTAMFKNGKLIVNQRNDHFVSIVYDSVLISKNKQLHDPRTAPSGLGGTIQEDLLVNNKIVCTSCHDVHISRNSMGCAGCHLTRPGGQKMTKSLSLRKSNTRSALCLICHNK